MDGDKQPSWSSDEREDLRKLLRMGLRILLAIVCAGAVAAWLSTVLGAA